MHNLKELKVLQKARVLVKDIYLITASFPDEEKFGLFSQMRRASFSIASNIAESTERRGDKEFAMFLDIAIGSACELKTQLILCFDLCFINKNSFTELKGKVQEIEQMIHSLREKFNKC